VIPSFVANTLSATGALFQVPKNTSPLFADVESVNAIQAQPCRAASNSQATRAYHPTKINFVRRDHPILQFHLKSTCCNEVSQNMREEFPLSIAIPTLTKASLE